MEIHVYIYIYFFYGTFTCTSMNNLDSVRQTVHFTWAGVAQTNAADSSIAHTYTHCGKKEREGGNWREKPDCMSRNYKKKRLEV